MKNPCKPRKRHLILQKLQGPSHRRWFTSEPYHKLIAQDYAKIAVVYSQKKAQLICLVENAVWRTAL